MPDDWQVQVKDLQRNGCKRNKVDAVLTDLIAAGYVTRMEKTDV